MEESALQRSPSRREYLVGWILGFVCLVVYLACPNAKIPNGDAQGWAIYLHNYASAEGTPFYVTVPPPSMPVSPRLSTEELRGLGERERSAGWWVLWNPHHLFYLPVTAAIFRLLRQAVPQLGAITFLQWWNALVCAATVFLLYRLLIRLVPGSPFPLPWCVFLATSVTFFRYATDGAQYPTAVMLLAVASGAILAFASNGKPAFLIRAGLWLAVAILFHQIVSIIVPFILVWVLMLMVAMKREGRGISAGWFGGMTAIALGAPVLVYVIVAALALGPTGEFTFPGLIKYATLYAHQREYWAQSAWDGFATNLRTFLGFYFGGVRTDRLLFRSVWFSGFAIVLPTIWLTGILNLRKMAPMLRWWFGLCVLWVLPLMIFLSFWVPGHDFYHLFLIVPLGSMAVIGAESSRRVGRWSRLDTALFWAWCLAGVFVNFSESFAGCAR